MSRAKQKHLKKAVPVAGVCRRVYGAGGRFIRNRSGWTYTGCTVMGYCTGPTSHFH